MITTKSVSFLEQMRENVFMDRGSISLIGFFYAGENVIDKECLMVRFIEEVGIQREEEMKN